MSGGEGGGPVRGALLPGLAVEVLLAQFSRPLGELVRPASLAAAVAVHAAGVGVPAALRAAVRDVLRQRGYRPTGRGKPSSEYLAAAAAEGRWPWINAAVDVGNVVSLQSGLPVSVLDAERLRGTPTVRCGRAGEQYVFHQSGQTIELEGLPSLCDDDGPCANAVKDAQRTKTTPQTTRVLAVVWGVDRPDPALPRTVAAALESSFLDLGARVERVLVTDG